MCMRNFRSPSVNCSFDFYHIKKLLYLEQNISTLFISILKIDISKQRAYTMSKTRFAMQMKKKQQ